MTRSIAYGYGDAPNKEEQLLDGCGMQVDNGDQERREPKYCSDEHRRAVEFCSQNDNNKVLMRETSIERVKSWGELRPYSISPIPIEYRPLPRCGNLHDYLTAIQFGTRSWQNSSSQTEAAPSVFVPFDCFVPSLPPPPAETCAILDQYEHVIFHGDSLTRHIRQAMYMSITGNYVRGGVMTRDRNVLAQCICDGIFSESAACRKYEHYFNYFTVPPQTGEGAKLCPNATFAMGKNQAMTPSFPRKNGKPNPGESYDWEPVNCADPNYKGVLLVLQGGAHYKMNSTEIFASIVQSTVTHPKYLECACLGKVRLIWVALESQSTALDEAYQHQSSENVVIVNEELSKSFISIGLVPDEDILVLDWMNMTAGAQSSDGLHSLSDVNLAKAAQIIYLAQHWPFPKPLNANRCLDELPPANTTT